MFIIYEQHVSANRSWNTHPFVDVHLQRFIVEREQLGMRTSCLIADSMLELNTHMCSAAVR